MIIVVKIKIIEKFAKNNKRQMAAFQRYWRITGYAGKRPIGIGGGFAPSNRFVTSASSAFMLGFQ